MLYNNHFVKQYKWDYFMHRVSQFGAKFVDDELCKKNSILRGDKHTIVHRLVDTQIPNWIRMGFGEDIIVLQIFAIEPLCAGLIHKDGVDRLAAFNVPVLNCDSGNMEWFDEDEYHTIPVENSYTTVRVAHEQVAVDRTYETSPLFSTLIDKPSLVNTDTWHRVDNRMSNKFRWMLSIRFKYNQKFEDLKESVYVP